MSFLQFWASDFWTVAYEQSVYWFLGVSFFLFSVLVLVYGVSERLRAAKRLGIPSSWAVSALVLTKTPILRRVFA
jgi:hypothetical protein